MKGRDFVDLWAERNGEEVYQRQLIEHPELVEQNENPEDRQ
jgi:hypothetical protein